MDPAVKAFDCSDPNHPNRDCCLVVPGEGGASCDRFVAICKELGGTSSGGGAAASCSGPRKESLDP